MVTYILAMYHVIIETQQQLCIQLLSSLINNYNNYPCVLIMTKPISKKEITNANIVKYLSIELNLSKYNTNLIGISCSKIRNLFLHMIRSMLPYTHSIIALRQHLSPNTICGYVFFLTCEFIVTETPTLTLRRFHPKIHIGEIHIVSILLEIYILNI